MKKTLLYLLVAGILMACSTKEKNESNDDSSNENKEKVDKKIEESFTLDIVNFINDTTQENSAGKLPQEFKDFDFSKVGALYDESGKSLSIYFANFDNPEKKYGMCCGKTEKEGQKTLSFIIKHNEDDQIDRKESFINYTNTESFVGLNMVDRTMKGEYEMHDNYVEGEFTYTNDLDSSAFITTTFKLNLEKE